MTVCYTSIDDIVICQHEFAYSSGKYFDAFIAFSIRQFETVEQKECEFEMSNPLSVFFESPLNRQFYAMFILGHNDVIYHKTKQQYPYFAICARAIVLNHFRGSSIHGTDWVSEVYQFSLAARNNLIPKVEDENEKFEQHLRSKFAKLTRCEVEHVGDEHILMTLIRHPKYSATGEEQKIILPCITDSHGKES